LITPYVVRNLDRPPPSFLALHSGTEAGFGAAPLRLPGMTAEQMRPVISAPAQPGTAQLPGAESANAQYAGAQASDTQPGAAQTPGAQSLLLSAPPQVQAGREFAVAISVPPSATGGVRLEVLYDSSKLQVLGVEGMPGRVQLAVSGTTTTGGLSGSTTVVVANMPGFRIRSGLAIVA
jgi:hypothetical protein